MRVGQRKKRLLIGLISIPFFIVASLSLGNEAHLYASDTIFGFPLGSNSTTSNFFPYEQPNAKYPTGNVINNVILVDLKNSSDPTWDVSTEKLENAEKVLNGSTDSLKTYMNDISYGNIQVTSTIYTKTPGGLDGYTPANDRSYYLGNTADAAVLEDELLRDILNQFKVKLADKTKAELDTNGDSYVDNITFVIRGKKDSAYSLLWPHQFNLDMEKAAVTIATTDGELKFKDYNIVLSGDSGNTTNDAGLFNLNNTDIGVIAHEYLHVYGYPDLYHNYKYNSESDKFEPLTSSEQIGDPLGKWDIMDYTISTLPQLPMVYTNRAYSPWGKSVDKIETIEDSKTAVTLQKVSYSTTTDSIAAILKVDASVNPLAEDEYFMVEYRKQEGWDANLPQSGLLVYRINLASNHKNEIAKINNHCDVTDGGNHCGNMFGAPDEVFIFREGATSILTGNVGSNSDVKLDSAALSNTNTRKKLGKSLTEVASDNLSVENLGDMIYYSDGSNSGIVISNVVEQANNTITFDVTFPEAVNDTHAPIIEDATGNGIHTWINGTPTISTHVSDIGRGIASISVTTTDGELIVENKPVNSYTTTYEVSEAKKNVNFEFKVKKNGIYKVIAKDHAGNISLEKEVHVTKIDDILPEITVGDAVSSPSGMQMKISYKDEESKINKSSAYYTTLALQDATSNLQYDKQILNDVITVDTGFQGKVCVIVKDNAGNISKEPTCRTITTDKIPPMVDISLPSSMDSWTNTSVRIDVSAKETSDAMQTGISTITITTQDGRIEHSNERELIKSYGLNGSSNENYSFQVKANGTYLVKVCDYAENCVDSSYVVTNIDQDVPIITKIKVENIKKMLLFSTSAHSISFEAHDEPVAKNSGLREIRYQFVEKEETYVEDITSPLWIMATLDEVIEIAEDKEGILYAYAIDMVGNVSKIAQAEIKRINQSLSNGLFTSGIVDPSGKVNIIGIDDETVSVDLKEVDLEAIKTKLGSDFLASHTLKNVYDISLTKDGSAYALTKDIMVRFAIDEALRTDGSLLLVAIDEDGKINEKEMTLGDGFVEFKTDKLSVFALVSKVSDPENVPKQLLNSPQTGDETISLFYILSMIAMTSLLITMGKKKYDAMNILDK